MVTQKNRSGEHRPSIEMATKIAETFKVSLDYLVGATDVEVDTTTLNRVIEL